MTYKELFQIYNSTTKPKYWENPKGFSEGVTIISKYLSSDISNLSTDRCEYGNLEEFIHELTTDDATRLFELGWTLTNIKDNTKTTFFKYEI